MAKAKQEVIVKQDQEKPIPVEVLAESIKAISDGVRRLRAGPLNEDALLLLIQDATPAVTYGYKRIKLSSRHIKAVLNGMESLERAYLKPRPKS